MKGKPKLPDFTTERERNFRKRNKIETFLAIIFAVLSIGGIVVAMLLKEHKLTIGLLCIYEGLVILGGFLFHIITWKKYGWEQMSPVDFDIYKMTGYVNKERNKEKETKLLIADFILGVSSIAFIIIGIVKLFK